MHVVQQFIEAHPLGVIATCDITTRINLSMIYVLAEPNLHCAFVTKDSTRKSSDIRKNGHATIAFFDESQAIFLEITGKAVEVTESVHKARLLGALERIIAKRKQTWVPPVQQLMGSQYVFMKLLPSEISYTDYSRKRGAQPYRFSLMP